MSDAFLTPALRANLLAISDVNSRIDRVSGTLATGRRVNLPGDDIAAFIRASDLEVQAANSRQYLDDISQATGAVNAAIAGAEAIRSVVNQLQALLTQARTQASFATYNAAVNATTGNETFRTVSREYDRLISQITKIAEDSSYNGVNLIGDADTTNPYLFSAKTVDVQLSATSSYTVRGFYLGNPLIGYQPALNGTIYVTDPYTGATVQNTTVVGTLGFQSDTTGWTGPGTIAAGNTFDTTRIESRTLPAAQTLYGFEAINGAARTARIRGDVTTGTSVTFGAAFAATAATEVRVADIGLGLLGTTYLDGLATTAGQDAAQLSITRALDRVNTVLAQLGTSAAFLSARASFNEGIATEFDAGRGKLIDADVNRAGAELTALQTLRNLGVQATSSRLSFSEGQGVVTLLQALNRG